MPGDSRRAYVTILWVGWWQIIDVSCAIPDFLESKILGILTIQTQVCIEVYEEKHVVFQHALLTQKHLLLLSQDLK
ncbi:hypothetical protein B5X24_HaOG202734 [Helicoverpa armigera]|uniref:Uncharacterized protein n=1 Tax=Helicoverpa armigera TaxID=29058 RepID=A0A2W1BSD3_HELAM|nr:hypothetical protein B5X24_HaOG202734 [Helicoverpa armigera]